MTSRDSDGFVHEALYYGSDEGLIGAAVPFLRAGAEAGAVVAVACSDPVWELLRAALDGGPRVQGLAAEEVYTDPVGAVAVQRRFVQDALAAGAPRVHLCGEPTFGGGPTGWARRARFEAVVNVGLAELPVRGLCLYDTRELPEEVLAAGMNTHPFVLEDGVHRPNPDFVPPQAFLRSAATDPMEADPPPLDLDSLDDLRGLRHAVFGLVLRASADRGVAERFTVAVNEVATNAAVHGRPPWRLRLWTSPGRSVCVITDGGPGVHDLLTGYIPAHGPDLSRGGMGLWLARQLCDDVDLVPGADGFTVRLTIRH